MRGQRVPFGVTAIAGASLLPSAVREGGWHLPGSETPAEPFSSQAPVAAGSWAFGENPSPWWGSRWPRACSLPPMPSPDASPCSVPTGGDRQSGRGRFLTFFSSEKWKPSFRQRGSKAKSPGDPGQGHFRGSRWEAVLAGSAGRAGCHCSSSQAHLPAVEFFRVFLSHHVESMGNGSILETKQKKAEAWLMVVAIRCDGEGHICAPGVPQFWRLPGHNCSAPRSRVS